MAKRRVRLTDENDPLNSTDRVLAGFEQVSKLKSHQDNKSASQQDNKSASQQPLSSSEPELEAVPINELVDKSLSQLPNKITSQEDNKLTSQEDNQLVSQKDNKSTSQKDKKPTSQKDNKLASPLDSLSTSQPVNKPKLRKSTFQISEEVLNQLEQLHLGLQLELGKKDAPYKEVIVEEAIVQLLEQMNSNRTELLEVLAKRQTERGN